MLTWNKRLSDKLVFDQRGTDGGGCGRYVGVSVDLSMSLVPSFRLTSRKCAVPVTSFRLLAFIGVFSCLHSPLPASGFLTTAVVPTEHCSPFFLYLQYVATSRLVTVAHVASVVAVLCRGFHCRVYCCLPLPCCTHSSTDTFLYLSDSPSLCQSLSL